FKSHCGGLVAPESDNNPWRYKISWNPRNIVMAGSSGAVYKLNNEIKEVSYNQLFDCANKVSIGGLDELAFYPNRDSLSYIPVYKLPKAATFLRTTLRYPVFFKGWDAIVHAGLTNDIDVVNATGLTFVKWSAAITAFVNNKNKEMLQFLGLFDDIPVPENAKTSADILQYLLETKLAMQPADKDMIVMLHEFEYLLNGETKTISSSLVVKGEDSLRTAMAKTVGLPLGIAAKLILEGELKITGLHIPTKKEIYVPVLKELEMYGVTFTESE
ncbi:MAG: saccharopine dehydrogenase C-terminal domain-containing protein, partial [Ferruginibacter sp.]